LSGKFNPLPKIFIAYGFWLLLKIILLLPKTLLIMLDIQTRKILFVQEFLSIKSEETLAKFENLLTKEVSKKQGKDFQPMTVDELHSRIDQSEADFADGRYNESKEVINRFRQ
jgi:hypothetical protein